MGTTKSPVMQYRLNHRYLLIMNPPDCFTATCIIWHNYHQPITHSTTNEPHYIQQVSKIISKLSCKKCPTGLLFNLEVSGDILENILCYKF